MVEQGDLADLVQGIDVVDRELLGRRGAGQSWIERRIDQRESARLQQVRAAAAGFAPQAERGVTPFAGQPAGQGGDRFRIAAGDEVVERRRAFRQQVENQLAHHGAGRKQGWRF